VAKIDILFSASSRPEFTRASLAALRDNTDWTRVRCLWLYLDGPDPETRAAVGTFMAHFRPVEFHVFEDSFGGPVAIMNHWISGTCFTAGLILAKIDNDVIVPPGWLNAAAEVMDLHPELDLLGLEPPLSRTPAPWANGKRPPAPELERGKHIVTGWNGYARCEAVGGVGLFRRRAFTDRPRMVPHSTYGGFTDWQLASPDLVIGWIVPPLALFLLDRLPIEPWASLSRSYIAAGVQRPWTNYGPEAAGLWEWWLNNPFR
jgi:hypothetical protein